MSVLGSRGKLIESTYFDEDQFDEALDALTLAWAAAVARRMEASVPQLCSGR